MSKSKSLIMEKNTQFFKNKKITLMGLGLLGRGVGDARFLAEQGADLIVTDLKTQKELKESVEELKDFENIKFVLGEHREEDFINTDMVIRSTDVPFYSKFLKVAQENNVPVEMSTSLFAKLSPATIVGITGTRGKSTVTHLIYEILKNAGKTIFLGGNVKGVSTLAHLPESTDDEVAVLELDSWQLQGFGESKISPHISVFTTFFRDHMNYYKGDIDQYFQDKAQIFLYQEKDDILVLGKQVESLVLEKYGDRIKSKITTATTLDESDVGVGLLGEHNLYNAGCAVEAVRALDIKEDAIRDTLKSFKEVPGRLEYLGKKNGTAFYNDTTSTTPEATLAGLKALNVKYGRKVILIMGGADKNLDMTELIDFIPNSSKKVILLDGTGTQKLDYESWDIENGVTLVDSMKEAVKESVSSAFEGDVVLLSPAFASFGLFKNEFHRGDQFVKEFEGI